MKATIENVAAGVIRVHSANVVNWYIAEDAGRVALIDAGLPPDWEALVAALDGIGRTPEHVDAVLLTHAHIDHTGIAERAREEAAATVYLHERDANLARHQLRSSKSVRSPVRYFGNAATRSLFLKLTTAGAFRSRPIREYTAFAGAEELADVPGRPRVVPTPGHTFGHSAFHFADRDVLFTGDALVTRDPYTGRAGPRLVARAATADLDQATRSLDAIAATGATTLLTGHGDPWTGGAAEAARLAREAGSA
jgi:glyoxylase-like metal-dependent hydrolase (beta-lactamase superfamily II)